MIKTYVKKPIPIKAIQFEYSETGIAELTDFCGDRLGKVSKESGALAEAEIMTLEDGIDMRVKHIATEGDYVVKGLFGEFWPVKKHIFDSTYEEVQS